MGFMDKAKKYAEQAQTKLDDVQKQFNEKQNAQGQQAGSGAPIEYDQHGRPVKTDTEAPHGDPLASSAPAAPAAAPAPVAAPAPDPERPHGDPLAGAPKPPQPPTGGGMQSGDPLAG